MFVPGQDVHAEESLLISGVCGDSNPVLVPCSSGGLGPPNKMVNKCLLCLESRQHTSLCMFFPLLFFCFCQLSYLSCRFNISPMSVNISTAEFSLLDSLPKVQSHNS